MKKSLLLIGLISLSSLLLVRAQDPTTSGVAKNFQWYKLIASSNDNPLMQTPQQIVHSSDGNLFVSNSFYSKERDKVSSIFNFDAVKDEDKAFSYGDDKSSANGGTNTSIYKLAPNGNLLWYIYTSRGNVANGVYSLTATPDGGFVIVLMAKDAFSKSKTERDILRIIQSDGTPYEIELHSMFNCVGSQKGKKTSTQIPILLKVGKEGKVEFHKPFGVGHDPMPNATKYDFGTLDGAYIGGTAVDNEGNIYVGGNFRTPLTIDEQTFTPKNIVGWEGDPKDFAGDFFLAKLDKAGKLLSFHTEGGDPILASKIKRLLWKEGKLYLSGEVVGNELTENNVTAFGKTIHLPKMAYYTTMLCLNDKLEAEWISLFDVRIVPEHKKTALFVDGISVGNGKVYVAGRCAGSIIDSEENVLFNQTKNAHRGYVFALDATTGKYIPNAYNLFPEAGISNVLSVKVVGKKVLAMGYVLFSQSICRVMDESLSPSSVKDYIYAEKAATIFDGDIVRNMFVGNVRNRNSMKLLTATGYKEFNFTTWYSLIVAHKLPFPFLSADKKKLELNSTSQTLDVYSSELTTPIKVTLTGEGFKSNLQELPSDGGLLSISFQAAPTDTPEKREGLLTLTSGEESYQVTLLAMTEGKKSITPQSQTLDFGEVPANETKSLEVKLDIKNVTTPILCTIEGDNANLFRLDKAQIDGNIQSASLNVTFAPTKELKGFTNAYVRLKAGDYEVRIPLLGKAIYTLGVSESELQFGRVNEGDSKSLTVSVKPQGLASGESISVAITEGIDHFKVDQATLPINTESKLTITFTPVAGKDAPQGKLVIKSSDLEHIILLHGANATGCDSIKKTELTLTTQEGKLILKSEEKGEVAIYDLMGRLLYRQRLDGEQSFSLTPGTYIVKYQGITHKVILQ